MVNIIHILHNSAGDSKKDYVLLLHDRLSDRKVYYTLNICRRWFSSSATTSRPCWSIHRCLGYWNMPGWVPFFPKQRRNFPLAVKKDIRWFPLSETIMFPSLSMAIPNGKKSSPGACPCFPNRLSGCPSGVNLQMQWLPRSATTT